jgi:hypothetical protein
MAVTAVDVLIGARQAKDDRSRDHFASAEEPAVNSENVPGRIARMIDRIADTIGVTGLDLQLGKSGEENTFDLRLTTRTGSWSWSTRSTGRIAVAPAPPTTDR